MGNTTRTEGDHQTSHPALRWITYWVNEITTGIGVDHYSHSLFQNETQSDQGWMITRIKQYYGKDH